MKKHRFLKVFAMLGALGLFACHAVPEPNTSQPSQEYGTIRASLGSLNLCPNATCTTEVKNLLDYVVDIRDAADTHFGKDDENYVAPSTLQINIFRRVVTNIMNRDWSGAKTWANLINYEIVKIDDEGEVAGCDKTIFHVLRPKSVSQSNSLSNQGHYFFRADNAPRRRIVVEVPHMLHEAGTVEMGAKLFRSAKAQMLALPGVARCNLSMDAINDSACSGQTKECNDPGDTNGNPFRKSDMAHVTNSFFQAFHEVIQDQATTFTFLQLHGMGNRWIDAQGGVFSSDSNSSVRWPVSFSVSNGTEIKGQANNLPNQLAAALQGKINQFLQAMQRPEQAGNTCNQTAPTTTNLFGTVILCATTNTQGRYTNGSANICTTSAQAANHQFIHIEMSRDLRDAEKNGETDHLNNNLLHSTILSMPQFPLLDSNAPCVLR